jgi:hypothetical protein
MQLLLFKSVCQHLSPKGCSGTLGTSGTWKKSFSPRKEKFNGAGLLFLSLFFFFTASRNALSVALHTA